MQICFHVSYNKNKAKLTCMYEKTALALHNVLLMRNYHLTDKISVIIAANGCVGCSVPRLRLTGPAGGLADALVMFPTLGHT